MTKIGWKIVVVKTNGNMWSVIRRKSCARRYIFNEFTYPKPNDGPLCVFATRKAARCFNSGRRYMYPARIYKCEYTPSREKRIWCNTFGWLTPVQRPLSSLPYGTVLANSVKLLKKRG